MKSRYPQQKLSTILFSLVSSKWIFHATDSEIQTRKLSQFKKEHVTLKKTWSRNAKNGWIPYGEERSIRTTISALCCSNFVTKMDCDVPVWLSPSGKMPTVKHLFTYKACTQILNKSSSSIKTGRKNWPTHAWRDPDKKQTVAVIANRLFLLSFSIQMS